MRLWNVVECNISFTLYSKHTLKVFSSVKKSDTDSLLTSSTSSTGSVNERFSISWGLKLNNQADIINIKSS